MKQSIIRAWGQAKEKFPDTLILVRYFGEYYTLNEDAHKMPPCGCRVFRDTEHDGYEFAYFPAKDLDVFLPRIIRNGNRIGIVDV